ncbi:DUF1176 domain-containing protein [Arsenicitalea aurantiaca]|uniref:DUF1176 domain-containing protein n=1 Tax=Arsenicitalea aurantiaca TaxID=1783274 RepID=A0A433XM52_9HYPH|nr:DUF1176 domain-containing protein [Arsenicitalea aurantiaca]RUT35162.1 DUF1176 domain-containing protein [Arsenicitalea aurantiaca]
MTKITRLFPLGLASGLCVILALPALGQEENAGEAEIARAAFEAAYAEECSWSLGGSPDMAEPERFEFSYRYEFDDAEMPDRSYRLYRFFCSQGAYNQNHVYFAAEDDTGIVPVQFAVPAFDVVYEDDDERDGAVEAITVTGFHAQATLTNSEIDEGAGTITSYGLWRGLGDAFSSGTWVFAEGRFVLVRFEVDASYDGEVTPETLVDYTGLR